MTIVVLPVATVYFVTRPVYDVRSSARTALRRAGAGVRAAAPLRPAPPTTRYIEPMAPFCRPALTSISVPRPASSPMASAHIAATAVTWLSGARSSSRST